MVGSGRDTGLQASYDFLHSNDPRIQSVLDTAMVNSVSIDGSWLAGSAPMSNGDDLSFIDAGKNLIGEGIKSYVGDMEALAAIGSRSVGEVVSGLTMIMTGGDVGAGRAVGEAFAYMPRSEYGQQRLQMVGEVMEPVAQGLEWTRTTLGDFGYDIGGAWLGAGLSAVPDALLAFAAPQSRAAFGAVGSSAYNGLKATGRAFAPTAGRMAESFLDSQGLIYRVVPDGPNKNVFDILTELDPRTIRTTQTTTKQQGATLRALTESMQKNGFVVEPDRLIDVVRMPDGGLTSLDNTRIVAADLARVKVQARVHNFDDLLPNNDQFISRFIGRKGEVPTSWGDAVQNRISNQSSLFRNTYPQGSPFISFGNNY
jgi:hypothetical protein